MKKKQLFFIVVLVSMTFSFSSPIKNQFKAKGAVPSIDLVDIQPANPRGGLYFMDCAPKTASGKQTAQFSTNFVIKNKESKTLVLTGISFAYQQANKSVVKMMTLDIDSLSLKSFSISPGAQFAWQNSRDYHEVDNAVFFEYPYPTSVQIRLKFEGYSTQFVISRSIVKYTNQVAGGAYEFPGRLSEMGKGEYWYGYGGHGGGSQFYAYDIKAASYDKKSKIWTSTFPGKDGTKNEDYIVYGKSMIAMGDGVVIDFKDGVKENIGDAGGGTGGGNWFKINNGKETITYMHMQPGSLTKSLMNKGAVVKKGDVLGAIGNAGNSSEPHIHVHVFQDSDADGNGQWEPLNLSGIHIIDRNEMPSGPDAAAKWTKVDKKGLAFLDGRRFLIWPSETKPCLYQSGWGEIGRHAIPENKYQAEFMSIWNCGYYPVWVDAYNVAGKTYFNSVFRYNSNNYAVTARHDMTKEKYQLEYSDWVGKKGYRLQQLESYLDGGTLKFAAIFIKKTGQAQAQPAYHAVSPEQHQQLFDNYTSKGFVPVNVSVTSVGGQKYYSAFYEKRNVGGSVLKSSLSQQEYQDKYDEMNKKKWEQVYINAYKHNGQTYFSVIWYEKSGFNSMSATRKSDTDGYQDKYDASLDKGLLTRCVTGYDEGGKHWFAAHWAK